MYKYPTLDISYVEHKATTCGKFCYVVPGTRHDRSMSVIVRLVTYHGFRLARVGTVHHFHQASRLNVAMDRQIVFTNVSQSALGDAVGAGEGWHDMCVF